MFFSFGLEHRRLCMYANEVLDLMVWLSELLVGKVVDLRRAEREDLSLLAINIQ